MSEQPTPKWKPLHKIDRRVLGVLIEKAKTTPDQYPMSLNALLNGCNQKSNRHPLMNLDEEAVILSVDRLRMMGAVAEVQGGGRVPRYRHYAADWMGIDRVQLSIMTELLLRGSQTLGELRTRVARMDQIPDLDALKVQLDQLIAKNLIVEITPEGRGQVVTHNLYEPQELAKERAEFTALAASQVAMPEPAEDTIVVRRTPVSTAQVNNPDTTELRDEIQTLQQQVQELQQTVSALQTEIKDLKSALGV